MYDGRAGISSLFIGKLLLAEKDRGFMVRQSRDTDKKSYAVT